MFSCWLSIWSNITLYLVIYFKTHVLFYFLFHIPNMFFKKKLGTHFLNTFIIFYKNCNSVTYYFSVTYVNIYYILILYDMKWFFKNKILKFLTICRNKFLSSSISMRNKDISGTMIWSIFLGCFTTEYFRIVTAFTRVTGTGVVVRTYKSQYKYYFIAKV